MHLLERFSFSWFLAAKEMEIYVKNDHGQKFLLLLLLLLLLLIFLGFGWQGSHWEIELSVYSSVDVFEIYDAKKIQNLWCGKVAKCCSHWLGMGKWKWWILNLSFLANKNYFLYSFLSVLDIHVTNVNAEDKGINFMTDTSDTLTDKF